jgi:ribosomal protein S18 acetylase RimI-like enzyme
MDEIEYQIRPELPDRDLNDLFASAWENHAEREFGPVLEHSLTYVGAFDGSRLVGFVHVAWDGGIHGFILDTTVQREYQRRGIGTELMVQAAKVAAERGLEWLHVDYEPHLDAFYRGCGYEGTKAGLLNLRGKIPPAKSRSRRSLWDRDRCNAHKPSF